MNAAPTPMNSICLNRKLVSKSDGSRPRVALKIIRQPERAHRRRCSRPARGRCAATAPAGLRRQSPEGAGRDPVARTGKVVVAISRARPRSVGQRACRAPRTVRPRCRRAEQRVTEDVESRRADGRRHRPAVARLLQQDRDGVLRVGGRAEAPNTAVGALLTPGPRTWAVPVLAATGYVSCGKPLKAPTAVPPSCVVTPVRPSKSACRHSGGSRPC